MGIILSVGKFLFSGLLRLVPLFLGVLTFLGGQISKLKFKDVKKYLPYLVGMVALIWLFMKGKNTVSISKVMKEGDPVKIGVTVASMVADYLGTTKGLSWWNPAGWTEDEKSASKLLIANKQYISNIEVAYANLSKSGDLRGDIEKYFNADQKENLYTNLFN